MIQAAEPVGYDGDNREGEARCKVGKGLLGSDRNQPATRTLDKEGGIFLREVAKSRLKDIQRKDAVFEFGGDKRGCRGLKPDRICFVVAQHASRSRSQDFDILSFSWQERGGCSGGVERLPLDIWDY